MSMFADVLGDLLFVDCVHCIYVVEHGSASWA